MSIKTHEGVYLVLGIVFVLIIFMFCGEIIMRIGGAWWKRRKRVRETATD